MEEHAPTKPDLPPPINKMHLIVTGGTTDDYHEIAVRIAHNEEARKLETHIGEDELAITFDPGPDSVIKILIEDDVVSICPDAHITWRGNKNEITKKCDH